MSTRYGILPKGGTIVGTSRTNPLSDRNRRNNAYNKSVLGLCVVAVGGDRRLVLPRFTSD
jgi:hypothetical protein